MESDGGWSEIEVDRLTSRTVGSQTVWATASFSLEADEYAVRDVRRRVRTLARSVGLDRDAVEAIETAVGEAALNAVKHGRPPSGRGVLRVRCVNQPRAFVVEVTDQGPGFQPSDIPAPVAENLRPSGYGIALMRGLTDKLAFRRALGGGTTVRLVKVKRQSSPR
ncbi:MAG: ATP-binding protein [Armatimonadota bacterium]